MPLLSDIARALVVALGVSTVFRLQDLLHRGALRLAFERTYEAGLFQVEFLLGMVLPFALLLSPRLRANTVWLYRTSLLVVMGFVVNRLNVSVTGLEGASGGHYVPAWSEIAISMMMVGIGFALFALVVRYFRVYPEPEAAAA
jgi:Ni/Fe-hydrogenase subunit HybB-like protein